MRTGLPGKSCAFVPLRSATRPVSACVPLRTVEAPHKKTNKKKGSKGVFATQTLFNFEEVDPLLHALIVLVIGGERMKCSSGLGPAAAAASATAGATATTHNGADSVVVIGCGMIGASAAKYLAKSGHFGKVFCVGLSECTDSERSAAAAGTDSESANQTRHRSIFGAHYDEGRITRRSDPNALWGELASCSIDRYRSIERESGIDFFSECGHLAVGNSGGEYIANVARVAREADVAVSELNRQELKRLLPMCNLATHGATGPESGVFEPTGSGWVSARRFVDAQVAIARKAGCLFVDDEVVSVTPHGNCSDPGCPSCFTVKCKSGTCVRLLFQGGSRSRLLMMSIFFFFFLEEEEEEDLSTLR